MKHDKIQKWLEKARKQTPKYSTITHTSDHGYVYVSEYGIEDVQTFSVLMWKDGKLFYHYIWKRKANDEGYKKVVIALKESQKLLIVSEDMEPYVFGNKEPADANVEVLVAFSLGKSGNLIFASSLNKKIKELNYWYDDVTNAVDGVISGIMEIIKPVETINSTVKPETTEKTEGGQE